MRTFLFLGWLSTCTPAVAQDQPLQAQVAQEAFLIEGLEPGPPPPPSTVHTTAHTIGKLLRCPVCQGLSIADSNAEGAVMIQNRIEELVAAGYDQQQITDYFVDKYGEWILLQPPAEGLNLLIWLGPLGALGIGLLGLALRTQTNPTKQKATAIQTKAEGELESSPEPNRYEAQLLKELSDDY
jgi:cytochrome c-type biogenesis protein CcmH